MSTESKCPECGVYSLTHDAYCSQSTATREEIQVAAKYYFKKWCEANGQHRQIRQDAHARAQEHISKAKKEAALWYGKYYIVKAENNVLRKKLSPDTKNNKTKTQ